jgi:trehalose utilization protein
MNLQSIRVTVWNEYRHEKHNEAVRKIYPNGMHAVLAEMLAAQGAIVTTATLDEPEHGLSEDLLNNTDVLTWWGHLAHDEVSDEIVDRVQRRVLDGMGLLALHSGHYSKVFKRLMGTSGELKWRDDGEKERIWVADPGHPIASGLDAYFEVPMAEMYGEPFDIPQPDSVIFISWFAGGEVFRSGCTFTRGRGKIFYFRPGHETFPIYYQPEVQLVIQNGVRWAAPSQGARIPAESNRREPLETLTR